ncbi:hypothetical protein AWB77_05380 [Caballeronia fortuita]|uniref:Uncharacterized protein n=1 Tax=Caballeronia fortuita TaxID=1777138 RepID=A0A158DI85_9BURK|nr:hypothetical protein AWB77_05380 [Caballeronia fortuita]
MGRGSRFMLLCYNLACLTLPLYGVSQIHDGEQ